MGRSRLFSIAPLDIIMRNKTLRAPGAVNVLKDNLSLRYTVMNKVSQMWPTDIKAEIQEHEHFTFINRLHLFILFHSYTLLLSCATHDYLPALWSARGMHQEGPLCSIFRHLLPRASSSSKFLSSCTSPVEQESDTITF